MSLSLRPITADDAQAMADLINDYDTFHNGIEDRSSADDMLDWWRRVDGGASGVVGGSRDFIAAGFLRRRGDYFVGDYFVHPDARGRGAGSMLLAWGEGRAAEDGMSAVRASARATDAQGKELLESRGYRYIRSFYRMAIDLDEQPPAPSWPDGFAVARVEAGDEREVYEALEEAFADHWGHEPRTFEEWSAHNMPLAGRLCYLVRTEDGSVAAAEVGDEERFGTGMVGILGVRPAWRRRGLGEALLRQAFHDLYARGQRRVALGVDAENTTGATRLYERVGMKVSLRDDAYEKSLEQD